MLSYYIVSAFLSQIDMSGGVSREVSDRIREGTFSKYMVIPANVNGYFVAQTLGTMAFHLIFVVLGTFLWIGLFGVGFALTTDIRLITSAAILAILGLLFMVQLNYFLGMLAFKFLDISFFLIIKDNLISFITGGLIPLALLPQGIVSAMSVFPFYYVTYLPSMLLIGKNGHEALPGMITLAVWLVAFLHLNRKVYSKMRVIFDGVGI